MGGLLPGMSLGKTKREIESRASSSKGANFKMVIATAWKTFVVDGSKDLFQRGEDVVTKTRIALNVALSDEWNDEDEALHGVNPGKNFHQKRMMFKQLFRIGKMCNDRDFVAAQGLYTNNFFSENYNWHDVDQQMKKTKEKPENEKRSSHACYLVADASHITEASTQTNGSNGKIESQRLEKLLHRKDKEIEVYKNRIEFLQAKESLSPHEQWQLRDYEYKLESNSLNPLCFDEDPRIAQAMEKLTETLITSFSIDEASKRNIAQAYEISRTTGKKLILNCNHAGHSDAYVYTAFWKYLIEQEVIPGKGLPIEEQKRLRFWCGFYMAFTPGIRKYLPGIKVLFGPGLQDMNYYSEKLKPKNIARLFSIIKKGWKADPLHEVGVIFSQGGRGEYGGMKEGAQDGTHRYLNDSDTIIVDIHLTNTDKIYMADTNAFATFNRWAPQAIAANISQPYLGGTKNSQEIYDTMIQQRDILQPERKGAQDIHQLYEKIDKIYKKISAEEKKINRIPNIDYLWENGITTEELGNPKTLSQEEFYDKANNTIRSLELQKQQSEEELHAHISQYNTLLASNTIGSLVKERFHPISKIVK